MSKIRIKNFGPIKQGLYTEDGWISIKKTTVFIGNQGSGKSTVAKLISTLSWIEKALVKGQIGEKEVKESNNFIKHLSYQRIDNYIKTNTEIEFIGKAYSFEYSNQNFNLHKTPTNGYVLPKIMYVPAERNFLSVIDRPDKLRELPSPLFTFLDEYDRARNAYSTGLQLPINKTAFSYNQQSKIAHISQKGYEIKLSEASSGFQSTVPLYLVTKYLSESLTKEGNLSVVEGSIEEQRKIEKEVKSILSDPALTPEVRQESLRQLSAERKPARFLNIVEEPEQNLFPESQKIILYELLKYANQDKNELIMTTHSPYLINYLTLAVKAFNVLKSLNDKTQENKIKEVIPLEATLNPEQLIIYEMNETKGTISKLEQYKGLPSDHNYLNMSLAGANQSFTTLQEIEKGWR